jgi:hypothetical protein
MALIFLKVRLITMIITIVRDPAGIMRGAGRETVAVTTITGGLLARTGVGLQPLKAKGRLIIRNAVAARKARENPFGPSPAVPMTTEF